MSTQRIPQNTCGDRKAQLETAKKHFYALRMVDAYHILRRFFDRLPFQPEPEHAEYIGIFSRILAELGKTAELKFYVTVLENWYVRTRDPVIGYPLAVIYYNLPEPRYETSRRILEEIISQSSVEDYRIRAKMLLAHYYDWLKKDGLACGNLIDSIDEPEDPTLNILWLIWRAKILKDRGRFTEAQATLDQVMARVSLEKDWYGYYSAAVVQAGLYLAQGEREKASALVARVRELFGQRTLKTLRFQLNSLEEKIKQKPPPPVLKLRRFAKKVVLVYLRREVAFLSGTPPERILQLLLKKRAVRKADLLKELAGRDQADEKDGRLIYHGIHTVRTKLKQLNLPVEGIVTEAGTYRLVPIVEIEGEDL